VAKRGPKPVSKATVTERQRMVLQEIVRGKKTPQQLAERAHVVLLSEAAVSDEDQGQRLRVDRQRVRRWRRRWEAARERLAAAEAEASDKDLEALIRKVLTDEPRSGAPCRFSAEQITDIIALACESPLDSGLPVSHWTPPELVREAINRGIVDTISPRHLDRFLKRSRPQAAQDAVLADIGGQAG
jgi:putative transposase